MRYKTIYYSVIVVLLSLLVNQTQSATKESVFGQEKLELLILKSQSYLFESSDLVRQTAVYAYELAQANHDTVYMSLALSYIGASYVMDQKYDTAFALFSAAERQALHLDNKRPLVRIYNNLATLYEHIFDSEKAFLYFSKANDIIKQNRYSDIYKSRLSLASYYCNRDELTNALTILNEVEDDAKSNNDKRIQLWTQLNRLETLINHKSISGEQAKVDFSEIEAEFLKDSSEILQNRLNRTKIQVQIYTSDVKSALLNIQEFPQSNLQQKKLKKNMYQKLLDKLVELNDFNLMAAVIQKLSKLQDEILAEVEQHQILNLNTTYDLSNAKMINEQLMADKNHIEYTLKKQRVYFYISILVILVLLALIVLLVFNKKPDSEKTQRTSVYHQSYYSKTPSNSILDQIKGLPSFILNENFIYQKANKDFLALANKQGIESLRGCNDFDLEWSDHSEELYELYSQVKDSKAKLSVNTAIMNCESELILLPLFEESNFVGIWGILSSPKIEGKEMQKNEIVNQSEEVQEVQKQTVLLVDDDDDNIMLLKRMLKNRNFLIDTASNGEEAIKMIKQHHYRIVFLDLEMPVKNGFETIKELNEEDLLQEMKIFALTAHGKGELNSALIDLFDDVLSKPIRKNELLRLLST